MQKKLLFSLIIFITLFFNYFNNNSLAYDDQTTHPALTDEIVDFYNLSFPNKQLTPQQKEWIVEGSILEDTPPRWINHFYDPINKSGWSGEYAGIYDAETVQLISKNVIAPYGIKPVSSLDWLHNGQLQAQYGFYKGIKTWEQGILEMIKSNEKEAYKILGFILHLIEDATVPDHTRNDTHAHELEKYTNDYGSPYEEYAKKYTRQNLDIANGFYQQGLRPINRTTIDEYLVSLAEYSNKYFFSKDTINNQKYQNPKIIRDDGKFGYGRDENGEEFKLVRTKVIQDEIGKIKVEYSLENKKEEEILLAYFSRLSRQAVLNGAGVIDLFHNEIEFKKEYSPHVITYDFSPFNNFEIPGISLTGELIRIKNATALAISSIGNFFSNIFGNSGNNQNSTQIIDNTKNDILDTNIQNAKSRSDLSIDKSATGKNIFTKIEVQKPTDKSQNNNLQNQIALIDDKKDEQNIQKIISTTQQIATTTQQISQPQQSVFQQCSFNTNQSPNRQKAVINEVAWMGTTESANNEWMELKNISGSEINLNGWQLIDQGEQIKITFENIDKILANDFYLLERTDDSSVSTISADKIYTGALSNTSEGLRLFDNQCNLIDEVLASPDWQVGNSAEKRTMERDSNGFGWHTSSVINGTPKKENSSASVVYGGGGGGNVSSNTTNTAEQITSAASSSPSKILINEIQITGGSGKTDHDFIELYNPNNFEVNLNGYRLVKRTQAGTSDTSIKSWTSDAFISANGYYLWANTNYSDILVAPDITTSATISNDNGITIRYGPEDTGEIIDSVGWGAAQNIFVESFVFPQNPAANQSMQRKSFIDTNNNADDFELQTCPSPKAQSASCQSSQNNSTDHLVISEIYPDKTGNNYDFLELYNPTSNQISLSDYSLKIQKGAATTTSSLGALLSSSTIASKGFFLIGFDEYQNSASATADFARSSYFLPTSESAVIFLENGTTTIDQANYNPLNLISGQSLERKVYQNSVCISAQSENEFSGNDCDTDSETDFEIRQASNPQNSQSLPEPRANPTTPQNFSIIYSTSTPVLNQNIRALSLNLLWNPSQDYNGSTSTITYKITDISNSSSTLSTIETASTTANFFIDEIGRDYNFSIQALDKDGLSSATSTVSISIPIFLTSLYFYQDPRTTDAKYLVNMNWNNYPFAPKKIEYDSSWRLVIFYLNKDAEKVSSFGDWNWGISANSAVKLKYPNCTYYNTIGPVLILPDDQSRCSSSYGGSRNSSIKWSQLEDSHLTIELDNSNPVPSVGDYFTLAFYAYDGWNNQALIAVDKTKYYFQNEAPANQAPNAPQNISFVSYDAVLKDFMFLLSPAVDVDSIDQNLFYFASFSTSTNFSIWETLGWYNNPFQTKVQANVGDKIAIKAVDDFNNSSPIKIITLTENNGEYGISVEDAQLPISNFQEILLMEQLDNSTSTKDFNKYNPYEYSFSLPVDAAISKMEVSVATIYAGAMFKAKLQEDDAIIAESNSIMIAQSQPLNIILSFRKTPRFEAGKIYKLVFETDIYYYPVTVNLYGNSADIYYKLYGYAQNN